MEFVLMLFLYAIFSKIWHLDVLTCFVIEIYIVRSYIKLRAWKVLYALLLPAQNKAKLPNYIQSSIALIKTTFIVTISFANFSFVLDCRL